VVLVVEAVALLPTTQEAVGQPIRALRVELVQQYQAQAVVVAVRVRQETQMVLLKAVMEFLQVLLGLPSLELVAAAVVGMV
jgi:hypothetical protein